MNIPRVVRSFGGAALLVAFLLSSSRAEEEPIPFPAEAPGTVMAPGSCAPKLLQRVAPVWPAAAKETASEVGVYVAFVVGADGAVRNARALFGRFADFESAAVEAVAQWKFTPGKHEGHFVTTQMIGLVSFTPPAQAK